MDWRIYLRLVTLTAGTLLPFFWMVVILGHRRQRNFERYFFFLCLALTCFYGSSLLALNAQIFYGFVPHGLLRFTWTCFGLGLYFIPPLVLLLHVEYASLRELFPTPREKYLWLGLAWLPAAAVAPSMIRSMTPAGGFDFERPTQVLGLAFQIWLAAAMGMAAYWQRRFLKVAPDAEQRYFHRMFAGLLYVITLLVVLLVGSQRFHAPAAAEGLSALLMISVPLPFGILIGNVKRFNFLQIGRQRNLIYAVFTVFLALLYLSFVRRAGQWLEHLLPPEATAALLLFLPVVFFEPLQRTMRRLLRQTAQTEVDRAQKLMGPINEVARLGDLTRLVEFSERWIADQLQLASVKLELTSTVSSSQAVAAKSGSEETISVARGGNYLGQLRARSHGAMISGETYAALEFVAEQLPAAFDLCRLIEEKLQLERELAERERMALVGQTAASISHNLKNPLGSIKTILQVQMESPEMPGALRRETQMVLDEINRLSAKLDQLLQFSRPGVPSTKTSDRCNVALIALNVVEVLRHEAKPSGVSLELVTANGAYEVAASGEAVNDILSNVVLNAIQAVDPGGHVCLGLGGGEQWCTVAVEDDGPGIPAGMREKILEPFFTTKARGTGLGLAIVARRLEELGGELQIESPLREGRGSRFRVILPLAPKGMAK
jgi:signal transduction histidine kinase